MCGRYAFFSPAEAVRRTFALDVVPDLEPRYNIAPTQDVPAVRAGDEGGRVFAMLHWGLVPKWAKERAIGNQSGGRVFLFLETDDFARDYARLQAEAQEQQDAHDHANGHAAGVSGGRRKRLRRGHRFHALPMMTHQQCEVMRQHLDRRFLWRAVFHGAILPQVPRHSAGAALKHHVETADHTNPRADIHILRCVGQKADHRIIRAIHRIGNAHAPLIQLASAQFLGPAIHQHALDAQQHAAVLLRRINQRPHVRDLRRQGHRQIVPTAGVFDQRPESALVELRLVIRGGRQLAATDFRQRGQRAAENPGAAADKNGNEFIGQLLLRIRLWCGSVLADDTHPGEGRHLVKPREQLHARAGQRRGAGVREHHTHLRLLRPDFQRPHRKFALPGTAALELPRNVHAVEYRIDRDAGQAEVAQRVVDDARAARMIDKGAGCGVEILFERVSRPGARLKVGAANRGAIDRIVHSGVAGQRAERAVLYIVKGHPRALNRNALLAPWPAIGLRIERRASAAYVADGLNRISVEHDA